MNVKQTMENVIIIVMTTTGAIIVHVNLDTDSVKMERLVKVFAKEMFKLFYKCFVDFFAEYFVLIISHFFEFKYIYSPS